MLEKPHTSRTIGFPLGFRERVIGGVAVNVCVSSHAAGRLGPYTSSLVLPDTQPLHSPFNPTSEEPITTHTDAHMHANTRSQIQTHTHKHVQKENTDTRPTRDDLTVFYTEGDEEMNAHANARFHGREGGNTVVASDQASWLK